MRKWTRRTLIVSITAAILFWHFYLPTPWDPETEEKTYYINDYAVLVRSCPSEECDVVGYFDYGYEYERFFSYYNMEELKNYLVNAGLEVVYENANKTGKTEWLQIIGKINFN